MPAVTSQEELLGSREMEQQGRELLASMRAADAHQRFGRGGDAQPQQQHTSGHAAAQLLPEFAGFPKAEPRCTANFMREIVCCVHLVLHHVQLRRLCGSCMCMCSRPLGQSPLLQQPAGGQVHGRHLAQPGHGPADWLQLACSTGWAWSQRPGALSHSGCNLLCTRTSFPAQNESLHSSCAHDG